MAESVLFNIADGIISKLGSSFLNEIGVWCGLTDELHKLKRTVATIEALLLDAEERSLENPQVKRWLEMLGEAFYDADDLLDEFSTEALRQQVMGGPKMLKKVRLFFSSSNQFAFGLKMGHKVKALRERLDEIAAEKNKFHLEVRSHVERGFVAKGRDQTHSSPPQVIIGRENEKEEIIELLLSSDDVENVSGVPIVGFGGLGKTTLAQLVYNDDMVKNHFELKMWVCVSNDFDVQLLVKKVLESASGHAPSNIQMEQLKNLLHEKINERKYLLVLDDVWNEDVNKWLSFKDLLAGGARGSKIVITARRRKVVEMSRPIFIHELRGLSENESWSLFKQVAFKEGQAPNPNYEALGKEIAAKCRGVPLAIKTIGGMLYFKDLESEWVLFKDKELWKKDAYKNGILPSLWLSYIHLPSHYKLCFAYCSLYRKDFRIPVEELIQIWKAQGHLKSTDPNECLRDVGFGYFLDLFRMSFFQDVERDEFGNIAYCRMHDLMHDLAIFVAGDNFSASYSRWTSIKDKIMTSIKDKTQHMSFQVCLDSFSQDLSSLLKERKIRALRVDRRNSIHIKEEELDAMFRNLRCLRVLDLSELSINTLSGSIDKLKHLRYLNLSGNDDMKKLPNSITNLPKLRVLKLNWCTKLMQLPKNIKKLVNLTDLDYYGCNELTHIPRGLGQLTRLEKLYRFVIAKDHSISRHTGGLDELHALNNLRGELTIANLRYVKNVESEFEAADLSSKKLQKLTLKWSEFGDRNDNCSANDVLTDEKGLEALRPHQNLKELSVYFYRGVKPPSWLPSISNLVSVQFFHCNSIQWLPSFDQLPSLKILGVVFLTNLEHIDVENGGSSSFFPSLTQLYLMYCPNLKGFVRYKTGDGKKPMEELPCFPCVSTLQIGGCPNLTCMPLFPEIKILKLEQDGIKSLMEILKMTTSESQSTSSYFLSLSQLERLSIMKVEDFAEDALPQHLPSLQHLEFTFCSFKTVFGDEEDGGTQWQCLQVLNSIEFNSIQNLVSLPKGLQYVTTLQRLRIHGCDSLIFIPEWMGNLIELEHLIIIDCPQLSERCKNNTAEDWPKISHIPNISIDNRSIQRNGYYLL